MSVDSQARSKRQSPRRVHSSITMSTREIAHEVLGTEDLGSVGRLMESDPTFPRPFYPYGKVGGARRWLRSKVETWVRHKAKQAQRGTAV